MDSASISALAALAGAAIGGLSDFRVRVGNPTNSSARQE